MSDRIATTTWNSDLEGGGGCIELSSSRAATLPVTFTGRTGRDPDGTTGPEELLAAAHSADYAMRVVTVLAERGGLPQEVRVSATATLGPDPQGGFRLIGIGLSTAGSAAGMDATEFAAAAQEALESYPLGRATTAAISLQLTDADEVAA